MMKWEQYSWVWVFNGGAGPYPRAIYSSLEKVTAWIEQRKLTGTLTAYPVGLAAYDWAMKEGLFKPKRPEQKEAPFIQCFTSTYQEHLHFEQGLCGQIATLQERLSKAYPSLYEGEKAWVFVGERGQFPAGVFESHESVKAWVSANQARGRICCFPVNIAPDDWVIKEGLNFRNFDETSELVPVFFVS